MREIECVIGVLYESSYPIFIKFTKESFLKIIVLLSHYLYSSPTRLPILI